MFAVVMTTKRVQKDYEAFLEDIVKRLLLLEKDIHILLISHRKTVKFDFDRFLTRQDAAALFGCSLRHLDRILRQCHVQKVGGSGNARRGQEQAFIRWGDLVDSYFVRSTYNIPSLKNRGGHRYTDEFERAYVEFFNELKQDLEKNNPYFVQIILRTA